MRERGPSRWLCLPALPLLTAGLLAGCGGGGSGASAVPSSPAAAVDASTVAASDAVAVVAGVPISKASYAHWLAVERKLGAAGSPSHQALGFLITSQWVLGEAAARHMSVSEAEVRQRYAQLVHQSFPKAGSLRKYLSKSGETEADLLARIKVELLASRIAANITAGRSASRRTATLAAFERSFQRHWKSATSCDPGYVMEDCRQYRGKPENLTASRSAGAPSRGSAAGGSSSSANTSGEVYTAPGAFSLTSSAFERNGAIPAEYTCAGKGVSPPLSWQKVPAKAAELFLFVIDDNASGKSGGIRWVVGNIDPTSTGVAAGHTPQGGVVGTNSSGKAAYSPVCPAKGRSDTIELVMYALSKKLSLSQGFQPTQAEAEYGSHKLLMGQAAVTYGVASR
jgi:Raf kinase inhibitor-like YbhB/YbcL family protein